MNDTIEILARTDNCRVIILLPVFKAEPEFLDAQIGSLERQTHAALFLIFVDADCSSTDQINTAMKNRSLVYHIAEPTEQLDSYRAFEFGLKQALEMSHEDDVFALCDQDDIWRHDRIARTLQELRSLDCDLVHSDAAVADRSGGQRHRSLHRLERRAHDPSLRGLLLRNTVTGMTSLLSRPLIQAALPFPSQAAVFFHHDLWLGLVAGAMKGIAFVDEPLVAYRQHNGNAVGAIDLKGDTFRFGTVAWRRARIGDYFVAAYLAKCLYLRMSEVAELEPARVNMRALKSLSPFLSIHGLGGGFCYDSIRFAVRGRPALSLRALSYFALRIARLGLAVRRTLGAGLIANLAGIDRRGFALAPGVQPGRLPDENCDTKATSVDVSSYRDPRTSARFNVKLDPSRQGGLVILLPTLNPSEIFAGIATAIDIGVGIAASGIPVTFIACDLPVASELSTRAFVARRAKAAGISDEVLATLRTICGVTTSDISLSPDDQFLATAWWSAHVAQGLIQKSGFRQSSFFYLIQDFEANFYPWGDESAAALASYDFDYTPIFNTSLLKDYFAEQRIGPLGRDNLVFHPSIDISQYSGLTRRANTVRRIAVYGRPEVPRNLFPTAMRALDAFVSTEHLTPSSVEIVSVGLAHSDVKLSGENSVRSLGKIAWSEYPDFLAGIDIGLSLMLSPHPSHLPIELAAAGAQVVTNGFGGKDLSRLSPSIRSVAPTDHAISIALSEAWRAPPASIEARNIDLRQLGLPLSRVVSNLSRLLRQPAAASIVEQFRKSA